MPAPYFTTEIAALQAAAATGELTVEQNGDRVTYRSMSDLMKALVYFQGLASAAAVLPGSAPTNVTVAGYDRD